MALSNQPPRGPAAQSDPANKLLFSHPRMVADLLRLLGEPWVDDLDLDRLARLPAEHVADSHRIRREDMPWLAPFKPGAGHPNGAAALVQLEFQSGSHPHMAERMLEYAALLRRSLLRGAPATVPAHVPLVVYTGRAPWSPRRQVEARTAWVPAALARLQPRMEFRFVDAKTHRGDHALDGNAARAWLALEAADAAGLEAALRHAARTFAGVGDAALSHAFEAWCGGVLPQRFGERLRTLTDIMEKPTMLAETLQEWEEQKINEGRLAGRAEGRQAGREEGRQAGREEGRQAGREEGRQAGREEGRLAGREEGRLAGREEERARLRRLAERHFDAATANTLVRLINADNERESP